MLFIELYNAVLNTSITSYEDLPFPVEKADFTKGTIITDYEQVEDSLYFINSGIVEISIKSYMTEKIIDFFFEKEMVCAFTSFLKQIPADVQVMALIDAKTEMIKHSDLMKAYVTSFEANKFGRILTEQGYIRKSDREKDLLTKTAEELYANILESHTEYISHIPVNKIAKHLGIHPESLSRIRKKMTS